ncbi:hypothetical protein GUITHDRAFT_77389, partial [Guillardia theta CCMP2712]
MAVAKAPPLHQVFVGNIHPDTKEEEVIELFKKFGKPDRSIVMRSAEGISLGYGFLEFSDASQARKAVEGMNLIVYKERQLRVDFADCRSKSSQFSPIVFIDQLPRTFVDLEKLRSIFSPKGAMVDCHLAKGPGNVTRGFAFVEYETHDSAYSAFRELNGYKLEGQPIRV